MENPSEVREDLLSLSIEIAEADELSGSIDRRLARYKEKIAGTIALCETKGFVRIRVDRDFRYLHIQSSVESFVWCPNAGDHLPPEAEATQERRL